MRYSIATEDEVKKLADEGRSLDYISTITGIPKKVIWQWIPALRPHDDIIRQSVKQRYHSLYPELEAKITAAFSPLVRSEISEEEWDDACKTVYDSLFEESVYVFRNAISDPPTFSDTKKLSDKKFLDYLKEFWDFDKSAYVAERNAGNRPLSRKYVESCKNTVHYWSFLKNKLMRDVTKGDIEILHEKLVEKKLSPSRIYFILRLGTVALKYAFRNGLTLLKTYEYQLPEKTPVFARAIDTLTVCKIFNSRWNDDEAYVANLIAYYGKLTRKETANLRLSDIYVSPLGSGGIMKDGSLIPVPKKVVDAILKYASTSSYSDYRPTDYIFYTFDRMKHTSGYRWTAELNSVASRFIDKKITFSIWSS